MSRIELDNGKYTIIDHGLGKYEFLRNGEAWPAGNELRFTNVVISMFHRIQDLEMALEDSIRRNKTIGDNALDLMITPRRG